MVTTLPTECPFERMYRNKERQESWENTSVTRVTKRKNKTLSINTTLPQNPPTLCYINVTVLTLKYGLFFTYFTFCHKQASLDCITQRLKLRGKPFFLFPGLTFVFVIHMPPLHKHCGGCQVQQHEFLSFFFFFFHLFMFFKMSLLSLSNLLTGVAVELNSYL